MKEEPEKYIKEAVMKAFCIVCANAYNCQHVGKTRQCDIYRNFRFTIGVEQLIYYKNERLFKTCSICGERKNLNSFYRNSLSAGGRINACKACKNRYYNTRKNQLKNWVLPKRNATETIN